MKSKRTVHLVAIAVLLLGLLTPSLHAHDHLAAGALTSDPGANLFFVNDADFGAESGNVLPMDAGDDGTPYAGYYYTSDVAFVVLAATPNYGGPETYHPGLGAHIQVQLESVEGPRGAHFGFWETPGNEIDSTNLTWTVPTGLTGGTNLIFLSENDGSAGADPYGHIHGRVYSVDLPGLYKVGFQFIDTSTNGPGGGPVNSPSTVYYLYFQAGVTIGRTSLSDDGIDLLFAAPSNIPDSGIGDATVYTLESSATLDSTAQWEPVGDSVIGDDHVHNISVPFSTNNRFFRLSTQ